MQHRTPVGALRRHALVAAAIAIALVVPTAWFGDPAGAAPPLTATITRIAAGDTVQVPYTYRVPSGTKPVFLIYGLPAGSSIRLHRLTAIRFRLDVTLSPATPTGRATIEVAPKAAPRAVLVRADLDVVGTAPPVSTPPPTTPPTTRPSGTFALRADNPTITVAAGQTARFGITVDRSGGYSGPVTFTSSALPAGTTANFAPNPTSQSTNFYVTPSAATPDGDYRLTASAVGTPGTAPVTATMVLSVRNVADFALTVPATFTVTAGTINQLDLPLRQLGSSTATVTLDVGGMPLGMSATFTPNPTFGQTTLTLSTAASVPAGNYALTITGRAGSVVHQYPLTVIVPGPPDFALAVPPTASVAIGSTALVPIGFTSLSSTVPTATMGITGLPGGVTGAFTPNPTFGNTTLSLTAASSAPAGTYPLVITATAGTVVHQYGLLLTVGQGAVTSGAVTVVPSSTNPAGTPGYGLAASPAALTIARGSSATLTVTVTPTGGFLSPVQIALSGLPVAATTAGSASGNTATIVISIPAGSTPGTFTVTVTGTSGSLSASVSVALTVV